MRTVTDGLWRASGLALLLAAWALGHAVYGPFVLPRPTEALAAFVRLFATGVAQTALWSTAVQALGGWLVACALGLTLGLASGFLRPAALALQPVATVLLGVPPVVWVVLALLWFGPDGPGPGFTVTLAVLPVIFLSVFQGMAARDPGLDELSRLYGAPPAQHLCDVVLPQLLAHLLPAAATALGYAWKVCVMSEVMASGTGIGGQLAMARAHLDLPQTMAWILLVVGLVLACDLALLAPLRRRLAVMRGT